MSTDDVSIQDKAGNDSPEKVPHDLIKVHDVEQTLRADKGPKAELTSFKIKDFTSKGDNYACIVTSIIVQYKENAVEHETSYVVKLNPCRSVAFGRAADVMFMKEIGFYTELLPLLNKKLAKLNEDDLRVPGYLHSVAKEGDQVIFLNDMRKLGYKMFDRKKGMDKQHVELIMKELARLHAISSVVLSEYQFQTLDIIQKFPFLQEAFELMHEGESDMNMNDLFAPFMENSAKIADRNPGYEFVGEFLRAKKVNIAEDFEKLLASSDKFKVICHGDCWNNNFLFRYGEDDNPVECCLLDLQMIRVASPALDLNYMLYCSLEGQVRTKNLSSFFTTYYASFASIMAGAKMLVKFTLPQFQQEFYDKNMFGLMMGMMLIPIVLMDSEDAPCLDDFKAQDSQAMMEEFQELIMKFVQKSKLLTPRFLSMFDEMKESGLFDTINVSKVATKLESAEI